MRTLMIGLFALWTQAALAGGDVAAAERERLSDEMSQLVQRQVWSGVERKFRELEKLGAPLTQEDYLNGAYAARELGDAQAVYDRLKKASQVAGPRDRAKEKEIINWLWDIDMNYGHVELLTVPNRSAELGVEEMPFDVSQRKAVEVAVQQASDDGNFSGLIPKGKYVFAGQPFSVEPGVSVRIEVSPRVRRQGVIDPVIIYRDIPGGTPAEPGAGAEGAPPAGDR